MFIYSFKASTLKFLGIISITLVALIAIIAFVPVYADGMGSVSTGAVSESGESISYDKVKSAADAVNFLSQFGWKFSQDPVEVTEVIIPSDFSLGYTEYAEMNKASGFDLEPYKGLRAKRWTYDILNYPGYENKQGYIQANILVYNGIVIGGDICSLEQGGFMHSLEFPSAPSPSTTAQ